MAEVKDKLVVQSKVKDFIKELTKDQPFHSTEGFMDALDIEVRALVVKAVMRCKGNGRRTVSNQDI